MNPTLNSTAARARKLSQVSAVRPVSSRRWVRVIASALLLCLYLVCGFAQGASAIRYQDFGAKGDGKTDDSEAIAKAHEEANLKGLPVVAADGATYYIGAASRPITIQTNTDFGKARFIIDDTKPDKPREHVFEVSSKLEPVKIEKPAALTKGQARIDVKLPGSCVVIVTDSNVKRFIRAGKNQNDGSAQNDVFLVDKNGNIDPQTPIIWDFKTVTKVEAFPVDGEQLVVRGGVFTTIANASESSEYYARGMRIRRSNVLVEGLEHRITGEGEQGPPYGGFISVANCANVTVKDTLVSGHKTFSKIGNANKSVPMGSYDISLNRALNVSFVRCAQVNDIMNKTFWGVMGTNFCKNLVLDGCKLSRFDAHQGVTNATIRNSTLGYMGVRLTGFGTFLIENTTVQCAKFISLREDYGSTWDGDIIIRNCRFMAGPNGAILNGFNDGQHDFGYTCHMPRRLTIEGLVIEDGKPGKKGDGPAIFGDFNPKFNSAKAQAYPYVLTREVSIKGVTTTSGAPLRLSHNPAMFKETKVEGL